MVEYPKFNGSQICASLPTDLYYRDSNPNISIEEKKQLQIMRRQVRNLCYKCEFINECLEWALHHERHGVWGGKTEEERVIIRKDRNITVTDPMIMEI